MPKRMAEKRGFEISKLKTPGLHPVGGVPGLYLNVNSPEARSWILRLPVGGRRREMGLGPYPEVSHVQAKEKAKAARDLARHGIDPIDEARNARSLLAAARGRQLTFDQCAEQYIAAHAAGWRNAKHADQWKNTLATYASPVIGKLLVRDVETPHLVKILTPIWATKTETASRVRGRIERVLGWATTERLPYWRESGALARPSRKPVAEAITSRDYRAPRRALLAHRRRVHVASARAGRHGRPRARIRDLDGGTFRRSSRRDVGGDRPRRSLVDDPSQPG